MRKKIFKYGCFAFGTTWDSWRKEKFKTKEDALEFIVNSNRTSNTIHCAICYFYKENLNHENIYVLKYKLGIYGYGI